MAEDALPSIEELEAEVEAAWERDRHAALQKAARQRLRQLESQRMDREFAKRQAERQKEARERDYALASQAHEKLYGRILAAAIDPARAYSLVFLNSPPVVGFCIFSDAARVAEVREQLRFGSSLYVDPERAATSVSGVGLGQFVKRGELLAINPTDEQLRDLETAARAEGDARRQAEANRTAAANAEAEAEHLKRRYGAKVS